MRAVELNIVIEDEDGKTYVRTFKTGDPRLARLAFDAVLDVFSKSGNVGSSIGPVLRKVTEADGILRFGQPESFIEEPSGAYCSLRDLTPEETQHHDEYRFRFDVTAVPVPEAKP